MKHYKRLDYIRIISCILVFLYHLNILKGGFLAVCTFFVMSGYLSCISILKYNHLNIKKYYLNRIKKLYLPLIVVVFSTLILVKFFPHTKLLNLKQETLSVLLGYNNFWQIGAKTDYFARFTSSPFIHLWYISILMQFDLFIPLFLSFLKKMDKKINRHSSTITIFMITILSTIFFNFMSRTSNIMNVYYNTFTRMFSLFFGVLLGIVDHKYYVYVPKLLKKYNRLIFILYSILLIMMCLFISDKNTNCAIYLIIATLISFRMVKYAILDSSNKPNKVIQLLSKISYPVYLIQYPLIFFMQPINSYSKIILIIILTLTLSLILYLLTNIFTYNKLTNRFKFITVITIIIMGSIVLLFEKDYNKEMKKLKQKLNENTKIIELKNEEYLNNTIEQQKKWEEVLANKELEESEIENVVKSLPIVGVGDSVLLGAIDEFYNQFPNGYFDGKVSRTIKDAISVLNDLKSKGKLGDKVILSLSTNGDYSDKLNEQLMSVLDSRTIYWVNAVSPDDPEFNHKFESFASRYPNIHIVKWDEVSKNHSEYFYADGIHVFGEGAKAYVKAIYQVIYNDYLDEFKKSKQALIDKHNKEINDNISFYGNDLLTGAVDYIDSTFDNSYFKIVDGYDDLYKQLQTSINDNSLGGKIVLMLDNIDNNQYKQILNLCINYKVYICNTSKNKLSFKQKNVKVINFYQEINNHKNYTLLDKKTLSKKGNMALINKLKLVLEND